MSSSPKDGYKHTALRLLPAVIHDDTEFPGVLQDNFDPEEGRRIVYRMYEIEQRIEELDAIAERHREKMLRRIG